MPIEPARTLEPELTAPNPIDRDAPQSGTTPGVRRAVVTGAAGFIGSHTAEMLLRAGFEVLGLDSLDPYYDPEIKRRNIASIESAAPRGLFRHLVCDITDRDALHDVLAQYRPDVLVHLAARAGVRPSIAHPAAYAHTNVFGTQTVLDAAHAAGCDRIVCASSSSVYGNSPTTPFAETDPVDRPISPYAATKRSCELIGHTHHHLTGASVAMLRFFTVFGPRQRPDLAIHLFLDRISSGRAITLFGDGSTSRDYTYVDDIVSGIMAAIERIDDHGYRIWNLGGDRPISLADLVDSIAGVVGVEPVIERAGMQPGDVDRTWADLTRSRAELGYEPRTSIAEGIARQFEWMRRATNV
ncbi:MAG: NAD-dependent epimerase/dehydratase family protein [Planctomycetota bacterium]